MDYEKKYNNVIMAIKKLQEANPSDERIQNWVNDNFPKFKQSKDEGIKHEIKVILANTDLSQFALDYTFHDMIAWLEKQGDKTQGKTAFEAITEVHNANKVEPKFKVGDWMVTNRNYVFLITAIEKGDYVLENEVKYPIGYVDKYWRKWTIEDAKDGDVLAENSCIFIIQKLGDNNTAAKTYCTLFDDGEFNDGSILYFDIDSTKPATKEQRDLLFQKMKEAGYEWSDKDGKPIKIEEDTKSTDIIDVCVGKEDDSIILQFMADGRNISDFKITKKQAIEVAKQIIITCYD